MSNKLAPRISLRPQTPADVRDRLASEAFGDLEYRWSLDPALRDDAIARLGFSLPGEALYMGRASGPLTSPTAAWSGSDIPAEKGMKGDLLEMYNERFPQKEGMIEQNTILYDDEWGSSPRALGHEYSHLGFDELVRLGLLPGVGKNFEEAVIEAGDIPFVNEPINLPSRLRAARPDGISLADTVQVYTDDLTDEQREQVDKLRADAQIKALELLQSRGEPPRAQPKTAPQPPDQGGIMSILRGLFGGG